ncbi:MAG: thermosome subunit [Methanomicrobiales archaeon]|nr:thermosome subunit [Methanomicrobiales archaeon]
MVGTQPIIILRDNVERTRGQEAQRSNIMAAKAIASAVRTTLGPRGMDKMLVAPSGDIVITNDGATILHEIKVTHPGAKMIVEVAETQDDEVGDGTTTACILVGALMEEAERMLDQDIHPTVIANGYRLGMRKALEILDSQAIIAKDGNRDLLVKVAQTAVTGKSIEGVRDKIADIVVDAVTTIAEKKADGTYIVDEDDIIIKTMIGDHIDDAELVPGFIIDKTRVEEAMPKKVKEARIALLAHPLEITKTQVKSKIKITSSDQMKAFSEQEQKTLHALADAVAAAGANAVFCQKGIADPVQFYLTKLGIFAIQDVPEADMKALAKAVGGTIVNKVEDLSDDVIGSASAIEEMKDIKITKVSGCENPKTVSILLKGGSQVIVDELERAVYDAKRVVQDALEDGKFIVGGAAIDTELLLKIREYAASVGGRTQLAIEAFANIFEAIPRTLAENSGLDPIDIMVDLKAAHSEGKKYAGLDVFTGKIVDMYEAGVIEPVRVKRQAVQSASEAACMLIRVDDMMITQSHRPGQ